MQGSYRTVRIVEIRNLFLGRLRDCVRAVEQQDRDLLVGLLADVHSAVNALGWLLLVNLSRRDLNALAPGSITVLNAKQIASQDHCHSLK